MHNMSKQDTVIFSGELKQTKDGFVYLDVPDEIVKGFSKATADDVKLPPYWTKASNKVGAHISVIKSDESRDLDVRIKELGSSIQYQITDLKQLKPEGWDEMDQVYFLVVKSAELEKLRKEYGLPAKIDGHEFHITIAVDPAESMHRLSALYEEAPEGISLRNTQNLGHKISKAMGLTLFHDKAAARSRHSQRRKKYGVSYPTGPRINTSPVLKNPRHRKFFGLDKPQTPY